MNNDSAKGRTSKATGQVKEVISKVYVDRCQDSCGKVRKVAEKTQAANCDFKSDLQKLWMIF
jgi:hypothetical protein